jgi:large subunit ribosomal protein L17
MRHQKRGRKLNRKAPHRKAMLANMATSLFDKERITTTLPRAKELRRTVDRLITYAKRGGLHNIRLAAEIVHDKAILNKLFTTIGPSFKDRQGGYCRIVRTTDRMGDCAPLCFIELVGTTEKRRAEAEAAAAAVAETTSKKKPAAEKKSAKPKNEAATEEKPAAEETAVEPKEKAAPKRKAVPKEEPKSEAKAKAKPKDDDKKKKTK